MTAPARYHLPPARRGFSFAEVMFAVVILGIGFIMVAGIFPVALQQTQATSQQASAAAFAKNAAGVMQQLASYNAGFYMPATTPAAATPAAVFAFDSVTSSTYPVSYPHGSWPAVAGSLISPDDSRFAFVPLYLRAFGSNYAQVYIISTQSQTRATYDTNTADTTAPQLCDVLATNPTTFLPKLLSASISGASPYLITFAISPTVTPNFGSSYWQSPAQVVPYTYTANGYQAVGTGCYAIVANDNLAAPYAGALNGKVYRIGNHRPDLTTSTTDVWELVPGSDYVPLAGVALPITNVAVWIVGKQVEPPGSANYSGNVQDVSLFTTFVPVPQ